MNLIDTLKLYYAEYKISIFAIFIMVSLLLFLGIREYKYSDGFTKAKITKATISSEWDGNHRILIAITDGNDSVFFLANQSFQTQVGATVCLEKLKNLFKQTTYRLVSLKFCS